MSELTTAAEVLRACLHHWDLFKDQLIPRCTLTGWEADLLVVRPSGWAEEVEIKVSAADFRAEFRKKGEKHRQLQYGRLRTVWNLEREGISPDDPRIVPNAHRYPAARLRDQPTLVRRFWFAMPERLAEKLLPEVPEPYGVLAAGAAGTWCRVLRPATNLQPARKLTPEERVRAMHSAYVRFWQRELAGRDGGLEALAAYWRGPGLPR